MNLITQNQLIPQAIDIRQNGDGLLLFADGVEQAIDHVVRMLSLFHARSMDQPARPGRNRTRPLAHTRRIKHTIAGTC